MPLSQPAPREHLHTRTIHVLGYHREDGLFDIEGEIEDVRTHGINNRDRGWLKPGDPIHHMRLRITVDDKMLIHASEAVTEASPYHYCTGGAAFFSRLAGLTIKPGFLREVQARVGGGEGCTHLRELIQQMATVAFQTMWMKPAQPAKNVTAEEKAAADAKPFEPPQGDNNNAPRLLDSCYAYAADSPISRQRWPELYADGKNPAEAIAASRAARRPAGARWEFRARADAVRGGDSRKAGRPAARRPRAENPRRDARGSRRRLESVGTPCVAMVKWRVAWR
jgi:hypothetical protein